MFSAFISGRCFCCTFDMATVWHGYKKSMSKRRPESVLSQNVFGHYVKSASCFVFGNSALFGMWKGNSFCISHFAPASRREGVEMLKAIIGSGKKVIFAVTCDLVDMLSRLGCKTIGEHVIQWNGQDIKKYILVN